MNKKLRGTTNLCVEIMNSKRQVMGETLSHGTNSPLPFAVNAMLNREFKLKRIRQTADSRWEFLKIENVQIKTAQKNSYE